MPEHWSGERNMAFVAAKVKEVIIMFLKATATNPYMGLDNKICKDPVYWCRLHEVWLSNEDIEKKKCKKRLSYDMMSYNRCTCLERKIA